MADVILWRQTLDGHVVQREPGISDAPSPSEIISKFLGRKCYLVYKGPMHRQVKETVSHPTLHETSTAAYQDGYPLLITTKESLGKLQEVVELSALEDPRWTVGGITSKWTDEEVIMER